MSTKPRRFNTLTSLPLLPIFLVIASVAYPINGLDSRKLDESGTTVPPAGDQGVKCTPCTQSPPPPSPPPPCPPPPSPPALPPPPPPSQYCPPPPPPPPPPSPFIYITGLPGNLYPIDQDFGGAAGLVKLPVLFVCGLMGLLAFW